MSGPDAFVLGAGPAGLAIARTALRSGRRPLILEASDAVGGLSKTIDFAGARVDLGPHVFGTDHRRAAALFADTLGDDAERFTRRTTMHWLGKVFDYPPDPLQLLRGAGPVEAARIGLSFAASRLRTRGTPANYRESAERKFGPRLVVTCIAPYITKLWGVPPERIAPDWEPGRIRNQSPLRLIAETLFASRDAEVVHPREGTGQFYDTLAAQLRRDGACLRLGQGAAALHHERGAVRALTTSTGETIRLDDDATPLFSTVPLPVLLRVLEPAPPRAVTDRLRALRFRGTRLVYLLIGEGVTLDDHIRYINDDTYTAGRIANFSIWTSGMGRASEGGTVLCHESWTDDADLEREPDAELVEHALRECAALGIVREPRCDASMVVRVPRTHPVTTPDAADALRAVRAELATIGNLHIAGRAGSFTYADQDRIIDESVSLAERVFGAPHTEAEGATP